MDRFSYSGSLISPRGGILEEVSSRKQNVRSGWVGSTVRPGYMVIKSRCAKTFGV